MRASAHTSRQADVAASDRAFDSDVPDFLEVAERHGGTIYRMAYALTGDHEDASDLTQDVFVRVYRNLDRYRPGTFEGWLYRVTKNLFLDSVRRRGRVQFDPLPAEGRGALQDTGPGPADAVELGVLRADLARALQQLPTTFRTAVVLTDVQGLTYAEVAERLGWPLGTVRSRVHRGRKALRQTLQSRALATDTRDRGDTAATMRTPPGARPLEIWGQGVPQRASSDEAQDSKRHFSSTTCCR